MIKFKDVSYKYPSDKDVYSVKNLNLHIEDGEFVVLCGSSGCGKTTVTKIINGLIPHFHEGELTGTVLIKNEEIKKEELANMSSVCGSMFQNPKSQFFNMDTTGELAFGCENLSLEPEEIAKRLDETISDLDLHNLVERDIFKLSGGEKQQIALGSIYSPNPDIYLLDEPTSNMDAKVIKKFKDVLIKLKNQGKTIVISEHRLYFLLDLADRFLYFKDGELKKSFTQKEFKELKNDELFEMGLRHTNLKDIVYEKKETPSSAEAILMKNILCVRNKKIVLKIEDLLISKKSIVAVIGENGAGKTTFAEVVTGILKSKGDIYFDKKKLSKKARIKKSYMVMQDVNRQLFCPTVEKEILLGSSKDSDLDVFELMKFMKLENFSDRHPLSLSGGQKQRVAICSTIAAKKEVMIFDEPTSGLDYAGMKNFCELMKKINASSDGAIIIITHDIEMILGCCTHALHLDNGEVSDFYTIDNDGVLKLQQLFF